MRACDRFDSTSVEPIDRGYNAVFRPNRLSVGLVVPLERYGAGLVPTLQRHLERVGLAETLGHAAVWLRGVPFNVSSFADAGQVFDPLVSLGLLAGATERVALGVASVILPLRHPAHVAKAAASIDVLSGAADSRRRLRRSPRGVPSRSSTSVRKCFVRWLFFLQR